MRKMLFAIILVVAPFLFTVSSFADERIKQTGTDSEGSFIYDFEDYGSFRTNLEEGKTFEVGFVEWDDSLLISLNKDGVSYQIDDTGLIFENGSYLMLVFAKGTSEYATFSFSISNDLFTGEEGRTTEGESEEPVEGENDAKTSASDVLEESKSESVSELDAMLDNFDLGGLESLLLEYQDGEEIDGELECRYSKEKNGFVYSYEDEDFFLSNVPNGAMSSEGVMVKPIEDTGFYLYINEELTFTESSGLYEEPGDYDFVIFRNKKEGGLIQFHFRFSIIYGCQKDIESVPAPDNFDIEKVTCNGEICEVGDSFVDTKEEGIYNIFFVSKEDKNSRYMLSFTKDCTPPVINFSKDVNQKKVRAPLTFTYTERNVTLDIKRNNMETVVEENVPINASGNYEFTITDEAGNSTHYSFYLRPYYRGYFPTGVYILLGVFIVLVVAYTMLDKQDNSEKK